MTDIWQPGHTYVPGSIVRPTTIAPPALSPIPNGDFETGSLANWTQGGTGGWSVGGNPYSGTFCAHVSGNGIHTLTSTLQATVIPGMTIRAQAQVNMFNNGTDDQGCEIALYWYDSGGTFLSQTEGPQRTGKGGFWTPVTVSGTVPSGAAKVAVTIGANCGTHGGNISFDSVTWDYSFAGPPAGLVYKATQASPGKSAATEPLWPGNTTTPVTDNQVTWQGVIATQLVWTASPVNKSGATEPVWPTDPGGSVDDNGIDWVAKVPVVTDVNCPHSKVVVIAASKVYAADDDIIRYSATVNPLDWSSTDDAGYLPFGLQTYGSNPAAAMNLYRSNVIITNAEGMQNWQVDEDPANSALLDALPIASTWNKAMCPVANDLLFLSSKGVRSLGIAATGVSLEAGDVGMPIDVLVQAELKSLIEAGGQPLSCYIPAEAQFWIAFSTQPIAPIPSTRWQSALGLQWTNTGNNVTLPLSGTVGGSFLPSVVVSQAQLATLLGAGDTIIGVRAAGVLTVSAFTAGSQTSFHWATNAQSQNTAVGANPITLSATSWDGQGNFSLGASLIAGGTSISFSMSQLDIEIQNSGGGTPGVPGSAIVFVYTMNRPNAPGRWSRYVFPFAIDDFTQLNDRLYMRSGEDILRVDPDALYDYQDDPRQVEFEGIVQTPWLDDGAPGVTKQFVGLDIVGSGTPQVALGYDQTNLSSFTDDYTVPADSVPGMLIPIPIMTPSASVRITYAGGQRWQLQAINLWLQNMRPTS